MNFKEALEAINFAAIVICATCVVVGLYREDYIAAIAYLMILTYLRLREMTIQININNIGFKPEIKVEK